MVPDAAETADEAVIMAPINAVAHAVSSKTAPPFRAKMSAIAARLKAGRVGGDQMAMQGGSALRPVRN